MTGYVVAVSRGASHRFSKAPQMGIRLLAGLGVEGDTHQGRLAQHRYDVRRNPGQSNLRQVHLLPTELLTDLAAAGFPLGPGQIGENVLTRGIDLPGLPTGTLLSLGETAVIALTGLRHPCVQMDRFRPGLMAASLVRSAGVMAIVQASGDVRPGDMIRVAPPPPPHRTLRPI